MRIPMTVQPSYIITVITTFTVIAEKQTENKLERKCKMMGSDMLHTCRQNYNKFTTWVS